MKTHDYKKYAKNYSELGMINSYYNAFKDIPFILNEFADKNMKILDYGCGAGRTLRFIKSLGYENIIGVDISEDMLNQAKKNDPNSKYYLIESGNIPMNDETIDIIFMSYVFLETETKQEIIKILEECKRILKPDGHIIFVTSIVKDIKDEWLSFSYDFPENEDKDLRKCQMLKLLIKEKNIILYDYNWTESEYAEAIKDANLKIEKIHIPLGHDNELYEWKSEKYMPYNYIYVLTK